MTIASMKGNFHSCIFLITSIQQVISKPSFKGSLVALWFFALPRERSSGASVSMFNGYILVNTKKVFVNIFSLLSLCHFSFTIYLPSVFMSKISLCIFPLSQHKMVICM